MAPPRKLFQALRRSWVHGSRRVPNELPGRTATFRPAPRWKRSTIQLSRMWSPSANRWSDPMTENNRAKDAWSQVASMHGRDPANVVELGPSAAYQYRFDPKHLCFVLCVTNSARS